MAESIFPSPIHILHELLVAAHRIEEKLDELLKLGLDEKKIAALTARLKKSSEELRKSVEANQPEKEK